MAAKKKKKKQLCCLCGYKLEACCLVLRLRDGKKEKIKRRSGFVACVAVSLKLVVLYYACGAASL